MEHIPSEDLDALADELTPGDGVRFELDFGDAPLILNPPKSVEGTFLSYDKVFRAWHILEWAPDNRKLVILNDWITSVERKVSRPISTTF